MKKLIIVLTIMLLIAVVGGVSQSSPIWVVGSAQAQIEEPGTITVVKFEDPDGVPGNEDDIRSPDWQMNVFSGFGCAGDPVDNGEGTTDGNGEVEFTVDLGLETSYSVRETLKDGWTNTNVDLDAELCLNVDLSQVDIDEVIFYNQPPVQQPGTIIVEKQVIGTDASFTFSGDASGSISNGQQIAVDLPAGQYSSTEGPAPGYNLTGISCDDNNSSGDIGTRTATFNLEAGETVICTFTNQEIQQDTGSIIAHKFRDDNGNGGQDTGEPNLNDWNMTLYSGSGCTGAQLASGMTGSAGDGIVQFSNLEAGSYSVGETLQPGWVATTDVCQNVTLAAGGQETVNFGNRGTGVIRGRKFEDLDGNGPGSTGPGLASWEIILTKVSSTGIDFTRSEFTDADGNYSFTNLPPGTYRVDEEDREPVWIQSFPKPRPPADESTYPDFELNSANGFTREDVDFGNYQPGTIIVEKVVEGEDNTFTFEGDVAGAIGNGGQLEESNLEPGEYSSTELPADGYTLTDITCEDSRDDGVVSSGDVLARTATFNLDSGETVICTFTNVEEGITAISLISFEVEANDGRAVILWETGTEIDNAGFNIYRAASADGPWVKVNDLLIGAEGELAAGASYKFYDTPGRGVFYYRLEDMDLFGVTTQHEPVMARIGPAVRLPWFRPSVPGF